MSARSTIEAEELVYTVADELGLDEFEQHGLDALAIAESVLGSLRIELKKLTGRELTVQDYVLTDPTKVLSLEDALRRLAERSTRSGPAN